MSGEEKRKTIRPMKALKDFFVDAFHTDEIFSENEVQANYLAAKALVILAGLMLISWILAELDIFLGDLNTIRLLCISNILVAAIVVPTCIIKKGRGKFMRLFLMGGIILCLAANDALFTFSVTMGMTIPVVLSIRYYNKKFTQLTAINTGILFALSQWLGTKIGALDINHVEMTSGTLIRVESTIENALLAMGYDKTAYAKGVMLRGYIPKVMTFAIISVVAAEIALRGYRMVIEQDTIAKEHGRIDAELGVAKTIQESALPSLREAAEQSSFDIAASMTPAKEVGGDFYDVLMLDETHLALVMADVSDKGVPAAMFMMVSKLLLSGSLSAGKSPAAALIEVNHQLCEKNLQDMFVTVWLGVVDLETGIVTAANAGHEYPILCKKGGHFEKFKDPHGLVLGAIDGMRYKEYEIRLAPGDTLFLYTDGVSDCKNEAGQFFGIDRICTLLDRIEAENMQGFIDRFRDELAAFSGNAPQFDDITMMGFRLNSLVENTGLRVVPNKESLAKVQQYLKLEMQINGVSQKEINRISIAVDEIYSNIVYYSQASRAKVSAQITDQEITVSFSDNGNPFDPLSRKEEDLPSVNEEDRIGGLGIFMAKQLMDEVLYRYEDGWNISTLRLKRS